MKLRVIGLVIACVVALSACSSGSKGDRVVAAVTTTTTGDTTPDAATPSTSALAPVTTVTTGRPASSHATTTAPRATNAASGATTTTAAAASGTVVSSTNNASYGAILVDARGRTLYLFTPDDGMSMPQCTGSCAQTWPPLKASGTPKAEGGAQQSLLGVEAGQVTYNGHPLYLYGGDSAAGQTNGEGVGGIWYVVSTSGSPVLH